MNAIYPLSPGKVVCPRCGGSGLVDYGHFVGDPRDGCWNASEDTCPVCFGDGEIDPHYIRPAYARTGINNSGLKDGTAYR